MLFSLLLSMVVLVSWDYRHASPTAETSGDFIASPFADKDWNACVQKVNSAWGGGCLNYGYTPDKYSVDLTNNCDEKVDLMCCVQKENGRWRCFYRLDMSQNDTLNAYACQGTGKFLKWVRPAGDNSILFPTNEEVNTQYK